MEDEFAGIRATVHRDRLVRDLVDLTGETPDDVVLRALEERSGGRMTLDARALVSIVRKEPGFERIVEALAEDDNRRIGATAMAEAASILTARGDSFAEIRVQLIVDKLDVTIVPFTKEHWKEAVREYETRTKAGTPTHARFGRCLSAAVAAKLGAPLIE